MTLAFQFPPGFEKLVSARLKLKYKVRIILEESGLIFADIPSGFNLGEIKNTFWVSSVDLVLYYESEAETLEVLASRVLENYSSIKITINLNAPFQLRAFTNNTPSALANNLRDNLLSLIKIDTGLEYSAHNPKTIFSLKLRESGLGYLSVNIKSDNYAYQKGQLHMPAASLLCLFGGIKRDDLVLDAFAGYGGLSRAALKFKPKKVIAVENDKVLAGKLKNIKHDKLEVYNDSVLDHLKNTNLKFNLIVADPPWGDYSDVDDIEKLYSSFLNLAKLKLKASGKIIILSSNKAALDGSVKQSGLKFNYLDILISGKKVRVYKLDLR
jgi:16S rRNA G966 N2-methylase RsmD